MPDRDGRRRAVIAASLAAACALAWPAFSQTHSAAAASIPDFSGAWGRTWAIAGTFDPPPAGYGPGPVMVDPARPHSGHQGGQQATPWIAAYDNPILKPHTREVVKMISDNEDKGIAHEEASTRCWPSGVPEVLNLRDSMQVLQTAKEVTLLYTRNQQVRHVYLDVPHSKAPPSTWYGESVGHYEGGTLVIDTIGVNDKSDTDRFGSPHSNKIHVIERYTLSDDKRAIKVVFTVEDSEFYATPWSASANYRRGQLGAAEEVICAENNRNIGGGSYPIPMATKADF